MAGPPGRTPRRRNQVAGLFKPNAKLDSGQVTDLRAPPPMDVRLDKAGHVTEWWNTANPGGISWNRDIWTIDPGPLNQGHRTPHPRGGRYNPRGKSDSQIGRD